MSKVQGVSKEIAAALQLLRRMAVMLNRLRIALDTGKTVKVNQ